MSVSLFDLSGFVKTEAKTEAKAKPIVPRLPLHKLPPKSLSIKNPKDVEPLSDSEKDRIKKENKKISNRKYREKVKARKTEPTKVKREARKHHAIAVKRDELTTFAKHARCKKIADARLAQQKAVALTEGAALFENPQQLKNAHNKQRLDAMIKNMYDEPSMDLIVRKARCIKASLDIVPEILKSHNDAKLNKRMFDAMNVLQDEMVHLKNVL